MDLSSFFVGFVAGMFGVALAWVIQTARPRARQGGMAWWYLRESPLDAARLANLTDLTDACERAVTDEDFLAQLHQDMAAIERREAKIAVRAGNPADQALADAMGDIATYKLRKGLGS